MDLTEDFKAFRDELESNASDRNFRRSRLRDLISNPRFSTFRQLSPTATAFHATPRAPDIDYNLLKPSGNDQPHPYAASVFLTTGRNQSIPYQNNAHPQSPVYDEKSTVPTPGSVARGLSTSQKPTTITGLPGMSEFAEIRAKRMSQRSPQRVTVYYYHGTPTLQLRLSRVELPSPAVMAQSIKSRPSSQFKGHSRFSVTSRASSEGDVASVYPASTTHGPLFESADGIPRRNQTPPTSAAHGHSPSSSTSSKLELPAPAYLDPHSRRFSAYSEASGISAAQAEIVDVPRRKLSFSKQKSALARAVLYPAPGTKVAMALSGESPSPSPSSSSPPRRLQKPRPGSPKKSSDISSPSLPNNPRPSPTPSSAPVRQPHVSMPQPALRLTQQQQQRPGSTIRESIIDEDGNVITVTAIAPSIDEEELEGQSDRRALSGYSVGSVPETLQAVRELARKFPGLPPGAVIADIGFRASTMTPVKESDEISSISTQNRHSYGPKRSSDKSVTTGIAGHGHGHLSVGSTDTEEMINRRIPAEMKMKGRMDPSIPPVPSPFFSGRQIQQLPPLIPATARNLPPPPPPSRPLPIPHPAPPPESQVQPPFVGRPLDPFDDTTSYRGTSSDLSPLSMSVKLRHPQSFISTIYPPTNRTSETTTGFTSPVTSFSLSYYQTLNHVSSSLGHGQHRVQSRDGTSSSEIIDFGTALKEWNVAGQEIPGVRPTSGLPSMEMIEGHRRSLSAQTRTEFERQQREETRRQRRLESAAPYDIDVADELPDHLQRLQRLNNTASGAPLSRIKSIGKVPRRITPQPTRSRVGRGSMHLQPLNIPMSSASSKDVPMSAVGAGGTKTILGVNKAGMNVVVAKQEQDDGEVVLSSTTEGATTSSNGRGAARYSEVLTLEDGGHVPIWLQGSRKGSYRSFAQ